MLPESKASTKTSTSSLAGASMKCLFVAAAAGFVLRLWTFTDSGICRMFASAPMRSG